MSWKKTAQSVILSFLLVLGVPAIAHAVCADGQQSCSSNYAVGEAFFGSGGNLDACSGSYCAKQSAGETAVGNTKSANYQAQAGFNTDREPYIEFKVNTPSVNVGVLSPGTTRVGTATFSVKTYLSQGYQVVTVSDPPANGTRLLQALASPTASNSSVEQFGINLVANSCPATAPSSGPGSCSGSIGANPVQVPDSTYSFGCAGDSCTTNNYNQPNKYMYHKGDVVASSSKSSGETDYTITYLFNITSTTPGGTYTMDHVLVATSTY